MIFSQAPLQIKQPKPPRPTRVYRLEIIYPGVDTMLRLECEEFQWPRNRTYLSHAGAQRRARLFREYGCTVRIVRSKPVEWEDGV